MKQKTEEKRSLLTEFAKTYWMLWLLGSLGIFISVCIYLFFIILVPISASLIQAIGTTTIEFFAAIFIGIPILGFVIMLILPARYSYA